MTRTGGLRFRAELALIAVAIIWGSTFVIVKEALEQVSTLLFLTVRFAVASLALALMFARKRSTGHQHFNQKRELVIGGLVGLCLFSGYVLQTAGLRYTTAAKTGFITGFYIPLVPLLGALIYRKVPRMAELAGIAVATFGMSLMTLEPDTFSIGKGDLLVLGCAFAYALHIQLLGHYSKHIRFERLSLYQIVAGALTGSATFWWVETPRWVSSSKVVFAVALTALLATAFAFAIQTWAQQFTTPSRTALIFSLEPVFAWVAAWLLSGEVLTARVAAGAGLILAGILLVELKPRPRGAAEAAT